MPFKGGYRPILVGMDELVRESIELKTMMESLNNSVIKDQDKVSLFILIYLNRRYPNNMLENSKKIVENVQIFSEPLENLNLAFKNQKIIKRLQQYNSTTLFDIINNFNLHSVPYTARYSLVNWYLGGKFDLVLYFNKIPSPREVLIMQANSKRCVSLIVDKLDSLVMNERDPLSFLLHDLVHAYKMFANDDLHAGQIKFYNQLLKLFEPISSLEDLFQSNLNDLLNSDPEFSKQFDYLISDMNSHPRHLFLYFKAIMILAIKRRYNIDKKLRLNNESLSEFEKVFQTILDPFYQQLKTE